MTGLILQSITLKYEYMLPHPSVYRKVVEASPDAITETDLTGCIRTCNTQTLRLHGYSSAEELIGRPAFELIAPEDREQAVHNMQHTLAAGEVRDCQYSFLRADGSTFLGELSASVVHDAQGHPCAFIAVSRDISERKRMENALRRERAFLDAAIDVFPLPVSFLAPTGEIIRRNQAAELFAHTHFPHGHSGVIPCLPHTKTPISPCELPAFRALQGELTANFEHDLQLPGNRQVPLMAHAAPIRIGDEVVAAVVTYQDISALREIDHAKDEFLAVLSHELQTPLTSMLGFTEIAMHADTLETYRKTVPIIERNARRQARLVNELLDMSKLLQGRVECVPVPTDLSHLAMTMVGQMIAGAEMGGVTLLMHPTQEALPILVDPKRLLTCIEHMIGNAIKFTPAGGRITVTGAREAHQAVLTVTDTGRGIDPAHLSLLFQPFQQVERDEATGAWAWDWPWCGATSNGTAAA